MSPSRETTTTSCAERRYSVLCSHRVGGAFIYRRIARHLPWMRAKELSLTLEAREGARTGRPASFTGRIFFAELERPDGSIRRYAKRSR